MKSSGTPQPRRNSAGIFPWDARQAPSDLSPHSFAVHVVLREHQQGGNCDSGHRLSGPVIDSNAVEMCWDEMIEITIQSEQYRSRHLRSGCDPEVILPH